MKIMGSKFNSDNWVTGSNDWEDKDIVHIVDTEPAWDGSQAGDVYYITTTDEIKLGITQDPYFKLIMGGTIGWDIDLNLYLGEDAINYDDTITSTITLDSNTINIDQVVLEVNNALASGTIDLSDYIEAYKDGTHVGLRLLYPTSSEFTLSSPIGVFGWSAGTYGNSHLGTTDLSSGHDWSGSNSETIDINFTFIDTGDRFEINSFIEVHPGAVNVEVYLNGELMENSEDGDYISNLAEDPPEIDFNYIIQSDDKIAFIISGQASLTNYVTKIYLQDKLGAIDTDILPEDDETYNIGSPTLTFNTIYAKTGYFAESSVHIGDSIISSTSGNLQFSEDNGTTFFTFLKSDIEGEDFILDSDSGYKLVLESDTAIEVKGLLSPEMTGATGNISTRSIGSPASLFHSLYSDNIYTNALYINNKKVLEDNGGITTISTNVNENLQIQSTGTGNIILDSENEIQFNAVTDIKFIDDTTFSNDVTIDGNLTVNGTTTTVNTASLDIEDNILTINKNQTGVPPSTLVSGIEVERGDELDYRFMFFEDGNFFKIGVNGGEQAVATRQDNPIDNGIPFWNNTEKRFDTDSTITFDKIVTISQGTVFPASPNFGDEFYKTDVDEFYKYNGTYWIQI